MVMEVKILETVKIRHPEDPDQFMIINKAEFNKKIHKLFDDQYAKKGRKPTFADKNNDLNSTSINAADLKTDDLEKNSASDIPTTG